jgi:hypothetical protein
MAGANGNPGVNKLCRTISNRAEKVAGKAERDLVLDFGQIQSDGSLLTNTFPIPIPRSDYHVCRLVGGLSYQIKGGTHGGHTGGDGSHTHTAAPPQLKTGDRVLVAWVQNEAVVIDVVI